jgi:predicted permease
MGALAQDLRYALRQFRKSRGFTSVAIITLALGIGAAAAIFGFVDATLLRPLPYASPNRLMSVNESNPESPRVPLSYPDYVDWQRLSHSFSSLDVYNGTGFLLRTPSGATPIQAERVSSGFFQTLGVHPMLGRDFYPGENRPGGPNVVILSYRTWRQRFGARPDVVGQTLDLDNQLYLIIGVLPRTFSFAPGGNAEFWVPLNRFSPHEQMRTFYNFWGLGRLRDGIIPQAALAEMTGVARQVQQQSGTSGRNLGASVVPLSEIITGDVRLILLTLWGGACLLLLIACVNVSSLVLVSSEIRRREIAVRGALGATPVRLVRQFLTEGLLLALIGSLAGVMFAGVIMKFLGSLILKDMALNLAFLDDGVELNSHIAMFIAAIGLVAAFLLAAIPTLRLSPRKMGNGLAEGDRGSAGRFWQSLGANMVIAQLAVAVVLLMGAALLGQSLYRVLHVQLGFDPNHLATVRITAPWTIYSNNEQTAALYQEISRRITRSPGVESAGLTSMLPVQCNCSLDRVRVVGRPDQAEHNEVNERHVSADYLHTLKASLVRGRMLTHADDASKPGVAVINQALAQKYFPGQDPLGMRIANEEGGRPSVWEIVGVVADVREGPLDVQAWPAEYFSLNQTQDHDFILAVRTA